MDSTWDVAWLRPFLLPIVLALGTAIVRACFPIPVAVNAEKTEDELRTEYAKWDRLGVAVWAVACPAAFYAWWRGLSALGDTAGFSASEEGVFLRGSETGWMMWAILLAVLTVAPVYDALYRRILGERYAEYRRWWDLRLQVDTRTVERISTTVIAMLACAGLWMQVSWYAELGPRDLEISTPIRGAERVPYDGVTRIETARVTSKNRPNSFRRVFRVYFERTEPWTFDFNFADAHELEVFAFVRALSARSGVPIDEIAALEETVSLEASSRTERK